MSHETAKRIVRRVVVLTAAAAVIAVAVATVQLAAVWRADAAPLDAAPVSASSINDDLTTESARTAGLANQIDQVAGQIADVKSALTLSLIHI